MVPHGIPVFGSSQRRGAWGGKSLKGRSDTKEIGQVCTSHREAGERRLEERRDHDDRCIDRIVVMAL